MSDLVQDVRFALRMMRKGWQVTLVAVVSLAVAIGGNTAVYGLIETLLFQPLTVHEPDRMIVVQERRQASPAALSTLTTSLPAYADMAERSRTTTSWAALRPTVLGLLGDDGSEAITSARVTVSFFETLGISPARGRAFHGAEGVAGARPVAIVTPEFWERARGGIGDPVGATLTLDGQPTEIVGLMPPSFSFLFFNADVLVPLTEAPSESPRDRRDLIAVARMAPGVTMEQVRTELPDVAAQLAAEYPATSREWTTDVFNLRDDIPDARTKIFYGLLQGSVFFVLLIACANITNLLTARSRERAREIALRTVLGAGKGRIVRQLVTESGLLVVGGAALGLVLGWMGLRGMAAAFAGLLPPNYTPRLDGSVLAFTAAVSVLAGLFFGIAPLLQTLRTRHADTLREGGGRTTSGRSRKLVSKGLVVVEIALSLVALGGGGMLIRSFLELQGADPGFESSAIVTAGLRVPPSVSPGDEERAGLLDRIVERARNTEGVRFAAVVNVLPRNFQAPTDTFAVRGQVRDPAAEAPRAFSLRASPEYVDVFGIEVLQGRFFEDGDRLGSAPVVAVNRSFARRWWPTASPVGRYVHVDGEDRQVVGVVEDVQQVIVQTPGAVQSEAIYLPAAQDPGGVYTLVASGVGQPATLKEPLRVAVREVDPNIALSQLLTMDEVVSQFFAGISVFNTILGGFGVLAILLAALGTYGVLAHQVAQRRHEIGIRLAIGAREWQVVGMIGRQGVWMAILGLCVGGVVLVPLTSLLRSLLAGFSSVRADTGVAVAGLLFTVTLAASLVPAYRAARLDPVRALRDE